MGYLACESEVPYFPNSISEEDVGRFEIPMDDVPFE